MASLLPGLHRLSLWVQSMQLSLFALPVSGLCMALYDYPSLAGGELLIGFNGWAWLAVGLNAIGGVAVSSEPRWCRPLGLLECPRQQRLSACRTRRTAPKAERSHCSQDG